MEHFRFLKEKMNDLLLGRFFKKKSTSSSDNDSEQEEELVLERTTIIKTAKKNLADEEVQNKVEPGLFWGTDLTVFGECEEQESKYKRIDSRINDVLRRTRNQRKDFELEHNRDEDFEL